MTRSAIGRSATAVRDGSACGAPTVAIFGSCVSRDLFEDAVLLPGVGLYAARCSIVSAVASPVSIDPDRVALPSPWQRRCVLADFEKSFFASLEDVQPDWLVIDLIDERFDLLRRAGSFVTRSSAFNAAGLNAMHGFEYVRRASPEGLDLFEHAAREFADRVTKILPRERVIVHRAMWCTHYRSGAEALAFPDPRLTLCRAQNTMLGRAYDTLTAAFGDGTNVIALDPMLHVADGGHRWGLEPYHYERSYNDAATAQLRALVAVPAACAGDLPPIRT